MLSQGVLVLLLAAISSISPLTPANAQAVTTGSYTPVTNVACPTNFTRRTLDANLVLDPREAEYIAGRKRVLPEAWSQWLGDASQIGYTLSQLNLNTPEGVPTLALASSGGGFR